MAAVVRSLLLSASLACLAVSQPALVGYATHSRVSSDLVVHEWGTFTSVAGRDGQAIRWHPRSGPDDLPNFVEHYGSGVAKRALLGTIRMETPVLYFYSPKEITVSVNVTFSKGVITEWYPHATRVEPGPKFALDDDVLFQSTINGSIAWNSVSVDPDSRPNFPHEERDARYYAARETSSAPVMMRAADGAQHEKFLFYRGVSAASVPVSAQLVSGNKVLIKNLSEDEVPSVILFERQGEKTGYRLAGVVESEAVLDPPELTATAESLGRDLEDVLMAQGLYPEEAHAMVETWRSSWSEEGSRVFYIVPAHFLDSVLPLAINPAPSERVRVFVGRIELITPATKRAVARALAMHDRDAIIFKYGRFLEPILEQLEADNPARAPELEKELSDTYSIPPLAR
jgi:hypothetical protein